MKIIIDELLANMPKDEDELKTVQKKHRKIPTDNREKEKQRKARTHRLCEHGAILEACFPKTIQMDSAQFSAFMQELAAELNHEQNIALIRKLVQELFVDKGMCAEVAFHDKGGGNPHAHILLTMRPLPPDGKWGDKSRLECILDADGNRIPAKQKGRWKTRKVCTTDWDDRGNAERWRAAAAVAINEVLREAGFTQGFVDPRSYADQGVQRIPMVHEGPDARALEKRGIPTEVGEKNREIRQQNKLLSQLEARLARLNAWAQYEKKKDELLTAQGEDVSRESLRLKLASNILASSVQPNRKDHRLRDSTGLLSIMHNPIAPRGSESIVLPRGAVVWCSL